MLAVAYDTLKLARKLESAGFPVKQAQDMAAAHAEAVAEWQGSLDYATKADVQGVERRISEMEIRLETRIAEKANDSIKWMIGAMVAITSLALAVTKLSN